MEIVWDESLTLEGRASSYDRVGALKDMIQNHLSQLRLPGGDGGPAQPGASTPCATARSTSCGLSADLPAGGRAVHRPGPLQGGAFGECQVPNYADEEGMDPARGTETFLRSRCG